MTTTVKHITGTPKAEEMRGLMAIVNAAIKDKMGSDADFILIPVIDDDKKTECHLLSTMPHEATVMLMGKMAVEAIQDMESKSASNP